MFEKREQLMKKQTFILCAVLLFSAGRLVSQETGVKFGFVRSQASVSRDIPEITWGSIHDISTGVYFSMDIIGGQWGLQAEVNFPIKGFDARETDRGEEISTEYKISYIEVPVLIYWRPHFKGKARPGLLIGPYFGFPRKVVEVLNAFGETEKRELDDNLEGRDNGIVFGGNVKYSTGSIVVLLDVRFSLGLNNISKDIEAVAYEFEEDDWIKNRAITVSLGVGFDLARKSGR